MLYEKIVLSLLLELVEVIFNSKNLYFIMKKEIRKDLYTQTEYARKKGITQPRVSQMMKEGKLNVVFVNGTVLIKHED